MSRDLYSSTAIEFEYTKSLGLRLQIEEHRQQNPNNTTNWRTPSSIKILIAIWSTLCTTKTQLALQGSLTLEEKIFFTSLSRTLLENWTHRKFITLNDFKWKMRTRDLYDMGYMWKHNLNTKNWKTVCLNRFILKHKLNHAVSTNLRIMFYTYE